MMEIAASSECGNTPYFSFYSFFFKDGQGPVIRLPVKVFVQYFLEHIKIADLSKQGHGRTQLQVIGESKDMGCVVGIQIQQGAGNLDEVATQIRICQKVLGFLPGPNGLVLGCMCYAEAVDLRKDVPHPMAAFFSVLYLRERCGKTALLCVCKTL